MVVAQTVFQFEALNLNPSTNNDEFPKPEAPCDVSYGAGKCTCTAFRRNIGDSALAGP